jgi:hypothetical protein
MSDMCYIKSPMRESDVYLDSVSLLKAFGEWCDRCERGCPMGCTRRKESVVTSSLLDYRCGSIMKCFSDFVLSKHDNGR